MTVDSKFWDKVYRENAPKLIGVCRRYIGNDNVAEDLVQETFLVAISKIGTYSGSGSIDAWLRKIAVNISLMHLRKGKTKVDTQDLITDIQDNSIGYDIEGVKEPDRCNDLENNYFFSAIDSLPIHHKTVFNLYVLDNYSHKEIAEELKISIGTSKSHLARARKKLQLVLKKKLSEDRPLKSLGVGMLFIFMSTLARAMGIDLLFKLKLKHFSIKAHKYPHFSALDIEPQTIIRPGLFKLLSVKRHLLQIKGLVATFAFLVVGIEMANVNNFSSPQFIDPIKELQATHLDTMLNSKRRPTEKPVGLKEQVVKSLTSVVDSQNSQKIVVKKQTIKIHNTVIVYDTTKLN